ncbi:MAG: Na/Pi cotransporter family protein [Clostridia bacterium]|nr:Na/Pi cotransporter family protein [Clostridia bacterium]
MSLSDIAIMDHLWNVVMMLAACGAFLIGFKLLSDNMEKIAGNGLKKLFNKTSDKKLVGVGVGAASTAVVQSSGVTTVMVVGFVNAGIMTLHQAAAMIMGANIGTTITAQLASLGSFDIIPIIFISLLFIGVMTEMFFQNDRIKSIGLAVAGLGLVFFGLEIMSDSMNVYSTVVEVQNLLSSMTNPLLLILFGIVFTALLQSSSAVTTIIIGMAMANPPLLIGGSAGSNAVLFIILGSNIGSCVTALISSIGTSVNARRASMMHLLFNMTGTLLFTVLLLVWSENVVGQNFYAVTFCKWFDAPATQIAMFHTFFNCVCTLLFLPFSNVLVKVATMLVSEKKKDEEQESTFMDKRFLSNPNLAISQLKKESFRMADMAMQSLDTAYEAFKNKDVNKGDEVFKLNDKISKIGTGISDYLVQVSAVGASLADEKRVAALHNNVGDISRIAELGDNLIKYTNKEVSENLTFSPVVWDRLEIMYGLLKEQYQNVKDIILNKNHALIVESDELEEKIDTMRRDLVADHIARMSKGECKPENNTVFINLVANLERIGDHLNFIAHSFDNLN